MLSGSLVLLRAPMCCYALWLTYLAVCPRLQLVGIAGVSLPIDTSTSNNMIFHVPRALGASSILHVDEMKPVTVSLLRGQISTCGWQYLRPSQRFTYSTCSTTCALLIHQHWTWSSPPFLPLDSSPIREPLSGCRWNLVADFQILYHRSCYLLSIPVKLM